MKFANRVNNLVAKFIRLDVDDNFKSDLLIMERIYPMDYRAYEQEHRLLWMDVFEDELQKSCTKPAFATANCVGQAICQVCRTTIFY